MSEETSLREQIALFNSDDLNIDEANRPYNEVADLVLRLEQQLGNIPSLAQ
jgi:hypothetical protein